MGGIQAADTHHKKKEKKSSHEAKKKKEGRIRTHEDEIMDGNYLQHMNGIDIARDIARVWVIERMYTESK